MKHGGDGLEQQAQQGSNGRGRGDEKKKYNFTERARLEQLFDQPPPQAIEAEMALIGSIIIDSNVVGDVLPLVPDGRAFYKEANAAIYDGLVKLWDRNQSGDLVQLVDYLREKDVFDDIGGHGYLVQLAEAVPSSAAAMHYAKIVASKFRLRQLIDVAGTILYDAYHVGSLGEEDVVKALLDKAEKLIFEIAETEQMLQSAELRELLHETFEILESNEGKAITGLSSGYYALDEITSGLQDGEMVIVAARPSMGKTAFALNLAEQIALGGGSGGGRVPVAFFSLEMSRQTVAQRMLCAHSGVDSHKLRRNQVGESDFEQLMRSSGVLSEAPIFIDDTPGMTIMQLRARARRLAAQHGVRCIIVDYLQLLTSPGDGRENRRVEVRSISRGVKAARARPVYCGSRKCDGRKISSRSF